MKQIATALVLALAPCLLADQAQQKDIETIITGSTKYVPLVIIGEGWSQQFIIQNVDDEEAATGTIQFFTSEGEPWEVEILGQGKRDTFFINLFPDQIAHLETKVEFHGQILGFAKIDMGCCPSTVAQTIFRRQAAGRPDLITSTPISGSAFRKVRIPFDNRGGKFAGVGILNTESCFSFNGCESKLRIRLRDADGAIFHEEVVTQRNQSLRWFSLSADYPQTGGRLGSLEVVDGDDSGDFDFIDAVGFSLQFTPNGAFTSIATLER